MHTLNSQIDLKYVKLLNENFTIQYITIQYNAIIYLKSMTLGVVTQFFRAQWLMLQTLN